MTSEVPFQKIDDLTLLRELGRGGLGTVYLAIDGPLERQVAIKFLRPEIVADEESRERFLREARSLSQLRHINIINFFRFGILNDAQPYLVMQYFPATTVMELMREPLETKSLVSIFAQVCLALQFAHEANVIHRDIKPSNILVDSFSLVKLIDFGLCKMLTDSGQEFQKLTRDGFLVGTPMYVSPETCAAKPVDARSDIYSLGCVLYHCAFGMPPFTGCSDFEVMLARVNSEPKYEAATGYNPAPELVALIKRAMQKDPDDRFQSAFELREALLAVPFEPDVASIATVSRGLDSFSKALLVSCAAIAAVSVAFIAATAHCVDSIGSQKSLPVPIERHATVEQMQADLDRIGPLLSSGHAADGLAVAKGAIKSLKDLEQGNMRTCLTYRAHFLRADCNSALGNRDLARSELLETVQFARQARAPIWVANSFGRLGYYCQMDGDVLQTRIYFNRAHDALVDMPITKEVSDAFLVLAAYVQDVFLSKQYYAELLNKYAKVMNPDTVAFVMAKVVTADTPHATSSKGTTAGRVQDTELLKLQTLVSDALTLENNGQTKKSMEKLQLAAEVCRSDKRYERVRRFIDSKLKATSN